MEGVKSMAKIVKKLFGHKFPERVHVLKEHADFDHRGWAKVSDEAAVIFDILPGYELLGEAAEDGVEVVEPENSDPEDENTEDSEDEESADSEDDELENNEESTEDGEATATVKPKKLKKAVPGRR